MKSEHKFILKNIEHIEAILETNDGINDAIIETCLNELYYFLNRLYHLGRLSRRAISAYENGFYYSKQIKELIELDI